MSTRKIAQVLGKLMRQAGCPPFKYGKDKDGWKMWNQIYFNVAIEKIREKYELVYFVGLIGWIQFLAHAMGPGFRSK